MSYLGFIGGSARGRVPDRTPLLGDFLFVGHPGTGLHSVWPLVGPWVGIGRFGPRLGRNRTCRQRWGCCVASERQESR